MPVAMPRKSPSEASRVKAEHANHPHDTTRSAWVSKHSSKALCPTAGQCFPSACSPENAGCGLKPPPRFSISTWSLCSAPWAVAVSQSPSTLLRLRAQGVPWLLGKKGDGSAFQFPDESPRQAVNNPQQTEQTEPERQ